MMTSKGEWLGKKLDSIPQDVDFVFLVRIIRPIPSSDQTPGGGHSSRHSEHVAFQVLEIAKAELCSLGGVLGPRAHYEHQEHNGRHLFRYRRGGARPYLVEPNTQCTLSRKER